MGDMLKRILNVLNLRPAAWARVFLFALCITYALVAVMNIIVDPAYVFCTDLVNAGALRNERFYKVEHLLEQEEPFDAIVMGSSRVSQFDHDMLEQAIGGRAYNFNVPGATPLDILQQVRFVLDRDLTRRVIVQIDLDQLFSVAKGDNSFSRRQHYLLDGTSAWAFYLPYLFHFQPDLLQRMIAYAANPQTSSPAAFIDDQKGVYFFDVSERAMAEDHDVYLAKWFKTDNLVRAFPDPDFLGEESLARGIEEVMAIRDLCRERGWNLSCS